MSAQDVVFTYKSVLDKKVNSTIASRFDALTDIRAPNERTVVFELPAAVPVRLAGESDEALGDM